VLLVFGLLVIPAVAGLLVSGAPGRALAIGWTFGFIGCFLGLAGSIRLDTPAAPTILVALTTLLAVAGIGGSILRRRAGTGTAGRLGASTSPRR
jgi:ABC-type Mn2+/Zn2+ transport system permease subunit